MSSTTRHIPFAKLVDLVDARLSSASGVRIQAHVDTCGRCTYEVAWLKHIIELMQTDDSEDLPHDAVSPLTALLSTESKR